MNRLSWWLNTESFRARKFSPVSSLNPSHCTLDPRFLLFRPLVLTSYCLDTSFPYLFFFLIQELTLAHSPRAAPSTRREVLRYKTITLLISENDPPPVSETLLPILRGWFLLFPNNLFIALVCSPGWGHTCLGLGVGALSFSKASFFFFLKQTPGGLLSPKTFTYFTIFYPLAISLWCSQWRSQHPQLDLGLGVAGTSVSLLVLPSPNGFLPIFLALFSACLFSGSLFFFLINKFLFYSWFCKSYTFSFLLSREATTDSFKNL